jgi:hypothetical protein
MIRDALTADAGSATNHAQRYSNCLRYNGTLILLLSRAMLQVNENLKLREVMFLQYVPSYVGTFSFRGRPALIIAQTIQLHDDFGN